MRPTTSFRPGTPVEVQLRHTEEWVAAVVVRPAPGGALVRLNGALLVAATDGLGPQIRRPAACSAAAA